MICSIISKQLTSDTKDAFVPVYNDKCQVCIHDISLCKLVQHLNGNVVILMAFSSLVALKVVKVTTFSATSDENFIKMMTFLFQ